MIKNEATRRQLEQEHAAVTRIRQRRLTWFGHVTRMGKETLPAKVMHCHIRGNRSRRSQPKTWLDNIKEDMVIHK